MTGIGTLVPSAIRVVRAATPPAPLTANPPSWSGERVCAEVPDDDDNVRVRIVFPDDQPIFGPIPNRDTPRPIAERPASDCRSARVGFQRVDRVIDRVQ